MRESSPKMHLIELERRWARCRELLTRHVPGAGGLLAFSRLNIYYLSGTLASGTFWLPLEGSPVLLCRKGLERSLIESPLEIMLPFKSYRELPKLLAEAGSPLRPRLGVEMGGLSWSLGQTLAGHLAEFEFLAADAVLVRARAVKSPDELSVVREAGRRQRKVMEDILPAKINPGMTEREIAHRLWGLFFEAGHMGLLRLQSFGEEVFLGHISAGDSGNYPSVYNGPLGLRGEHPAVPYMGNAAHAWREGEPLAIDTGFCLDGYVTDKTQIYWAGRGESIPDKAADAYHTCVEIEEWMAGHLKPGAVPSELAEKAWEKARVAGWEEGFMGLGGNKVNFLGHGVGLAVDEWPVLARGFDEPLEEGMVLALEPKIGLPGLGMVGVENTFEVTAEGGRNLTGSGRGIIPVSG